MKPSPVTPLLYSHRHDPQSNLKIIQYSVHRQSTHQQSTISHLAHHTITQPYQLTRFRTRKRDLGVGRWKHYSFINVQCSCFNSLVQVDETTIPKNEYLNNHKTNPPFSLNQRTRIKNIPARTLNILQTILPPSQLKHPTISRKLPLFLVTLA